MLGLIVVYSMPQTLKPAYMCERQQLYQEVMLAWQSLSDMLLPSGRSVTCHVL